MYALDGSSNINVLEGKGKYSDKGLKPFSGYPILEYLSNSLRRMMETFTFSLYFLMICTFCIFYLFLHILVYNNLSDGPYICLVCMRVPLRINKFRKFADTSIDLLIFRKCSTIRICDLRTRSFLLFADLKLLQVRKYTIFLLRTL
jgi:hypothetical protein